MAKLSICVRRNDVETAERTFGGISEIFMEDKDTMVAASVLLSNLHANNRADFKRRQLAEGLNVRRMSLKLQKSEKIMFEKE